MITTKHAFAEVIESSLQGFTSQSWQWNQFPSFGSLVIVESNNRTLFGLVHQINTGSMDPTRYPFPYKKTEEELLKEQPQIFEFLKTTFSCITIGYQEKKDIYYLTTPEPAKIHSFVCPSTVELSKQFLSSNAYLNLLFGSSSLLFNLDEVLLALLKYMNNLKMLKKETLSEFFEKFSLLTGNDYKRLKLFSHRVQSLTKIQ